MDGQESQAERTFLLLSVGGNLLIGCVGIIAAWISSSQAILLDGLFNLMYMASGLFTLKVAQLVQRGDDERFPAGYAYFEPLVNGIKGVLVLGISVMALAGAVEALASGGRPISPGLAVGYGVFATIVCWVMALAARIGHRRSGSPLVRVDAVNWVINAAISSCVLLAFVGMYLIRDTSLSWMVPYVDPSLVLIVVVITIGVPVRMARQALMELLNRAPSAEIVRQVHTIVETSLADIPVRQLMVRVVQPGRTRIVLAHVVLAEDSTLVELRSLDRVRAGTLDRLREAHLATLLDIVFTADPRWGAPLGVPTDER